MSEAYDVLLSFTDQSESDADFVGRFLGGEARVYNYKEERKHDAGLNLKELTIQRYSLLPCIIFATSDWYERAMTRMEWVLLNASLAPKLTFDYTGQFMTRVNVNDMSLFTLGSFTENDEIDLSCVSRFLRRVAEFYRVAAKP